MKASKLLLSALMACAFVLVAVFVGPSPGSEPVASDKTPLAFLMTNTMDAEPALSVEGMAGDIAGIGVCGQAVCSVRVHKERRFLFWTRNTDRQYLTHPCQPRSKASQASPAAGDPPKVWSLPLPMPRRIAPQTSQPCPSGACPKAKGG
jgi:hypothetical protein